MSGRLHGVIAEFTTPEAAIAAVKAAKNAGYSRLDVFAPYPMRDIADLLGVRPSIIPWIAWIAGLTGGAIQYALQYWMNAVDYPLNVGGRPLHSWPAFIPSSLIVAILWTGATTLISMLLLIRLPRLHHPVFAVPGFQRASEDRFFLLVTSDDPQFDPAHAHALLQQLDPVAIRDVPE